MIRILNLDPEFYSEKACELLRSVGEYSEKTMTRTEFCSEVENVDVLILRFSHRIDSEILNRAKKLKVIGTNVTGLDCLDISEIKKRGIVLFSLKGETEFLRTIHATAEHTWGLLLSLVRRVPQAFDSVKAGAWKRNNFVGVELFGKNIGIVGLGRIGEKIAKYAQAFSMKVFAFDPVKRDIPGIIHCRTLEELLSKSQFLTLHVPLSKDTLHLLNERTLSLLPDKAWLVNTSRGKVVNEAALLSALNSGCLAGAALDVLEEEETPIFSNPLREYANTHDNLILTPHIGGATWESWEKTEVFIAEKVSEYLRRNVK